MDAFWVAKESALAFMIDTKGLVMKSVHDFSSLDGKGSKLQK